MERGPTQAGAEAQSPRHSAMKWGQNEGQRRQTKVAQEQTLLPSRSGRTGPELAGPEKIVDKGDWHVTRHVQRVMKD